MRTLGTKAICLPFLEIPLELEKCSSCVLACLDTNKVKGGRNVRKKKNQKCSEEKMLRGEGCSHPPMPPWCRLSQMYCTGCIVVYKTSEWSLCEMEVGLGKICSKTQTRS